MIQFRLKKYLYDRVRFVTSWGAEKTGEVCILGDKIGISTPTEVFSYKQVKRVRRVK